MVGKCLEWSQNGAAWDKGLQQEINGDGKQGNEWGVNQVGGGQFLKGLKYTKKFIL